MLMLKFWFATAAILGGFCFLGLIADGYLDPVIGYVWRKVSTAFSALHARAARRARPRRVVVTTRRVVTLLDAVVLIARDTANRVSAQINQRSK